MDYTGTFHKGMIEPDGLVSLPEGTRVHFHVVGSQNGTPTPIKELRELSGRFFNFAAAVGGTLLEPSFDLWPEEDSIDDFLAFVREARR